MDWLPLAFAVFAAWAVLTVVSNEKRRLTEEAEAAAKATAAPAAEAVADATPVAH
jgi:hypothetical protein